MSAKRNRTEPKSKARKGFIHIRLNEGFFVTVGWILALILFELIVANHLA